MEKDDRPSYLVAETIHDLRLIEIPCQPGGARSAIQWREAVSQMVETTLDGWPVQGPRTVLWCCLFIDRRMGGPLDHFKFFMTP